MLAGCRKPVGFAAQAIFTARFLVQWIATERARASVIPISFWFFSVAGGFLLLVYALYRRAIGGSRSDCKIFQTLILQIQETCELRY